MLSNLLPFDIKSYEIEDAKDPIFLCLGMYSNYPIEFNSWVFSVFEFIIDCFADLFRANLSEANLSRANLSRADLSGANFESVNGSKLYLYNCKIMNQLF
jgi:hypothetical protein